MRSRVFALAAAAALLGAAAPHAPNVQQAEVRSPVTGLDQVKLQRGAAAAQASLAGVESDGSYWGVGGPGGFIRRPFRTVAQDKRDARKRNGVRKHKKAMRG